MSKLNISRTLSECTKQFLAAPQLDDAERLPSQKVQDLAEAVVSLTLQVKFG